jgi:hypothetical protein
MMRIYQEIALYGTSEKRLNLKRGIQRIRDFMMPEPHHLSISIKGKTLKDV